MLAALPKEHKRVGAEVQKQTLPRRLLGLEQGMQETAGACGVPRNGSKLHLVGRLRQMLIEWMAGPSPGQP
jgi:hypothetical protein